MENKTERMKTDLNIIQHNVRGLNSNKSQVINYLNENNAHICLATEIWLKQNDDFFIRDYRFIDRRRSDGYGGAAIFIKNNIFIKEVDLPEFQLINAVAGETTNLERNVAFVSVYVPAKKKELREDEVRKEINELLEAVTLMDNCIVGGDFNAFNLAWGSSYNEDRGILLMEKMKSFCLLNDGKPTRISTNKEANPLDLTWTTGNLRERLEWQVEEESLGSDHLVIKIRLEQAMNSEAIKVKPKVDEARFTKNVEEMVVEEICDFQSFIESVERMKEGATTRGQIWKNPKHVPKPY